MNLHVRVTPAILAGESKSNRTSPSKPLQKNSSEMRFTRIFVFYSYGIAPRKAEKPIIQRLPSDFLGFFGSVKVTRASHVSCVVAGVSKLSQATSADRLCSGSWCTHVRALQHSTACIEICEGNHYNWVPMSLILKYRRHQRKTLAFRHFPRPRLALNFTAVFPRYILNCLVSIH